MDCNTIDGIEQNSLYFTTSDILDLYNVAIKNNIDTLDGLVQYFNGKFKCNDVIELLRELIDKGVTVISKLNISPVTKKYEVKDGIFYMDMLPLNMDGFYFVNNLVQVRLIDDNGNLTRSYELFDDPVFDPSTLKVTLDEPINGRATVTYFIMNE